MSRYGGRAPQVPPSRPPSVIPINKESRTSGIPHMPQPVSLQPQSAPYGGPPPNVGQQGPMDPVHYPAPTGQGLANGSDIYNDMPVEPYPLQQMDDSFTSMPPDPANAAPQGPSPLPPMALPVQNKLPRAAVLFNLLRNTPRFLSILVSVLGCILEIVLVTQDAMHFLDRGVQPTAYTPSPALPAVTKTVTAGNGGAASKSRKPTQTSSRDRAEQSLLGRRQPTARPHSSLSQPRHPHPRYVRMTKRTALGESGIPAPLYVDETDIPWRMGAAGFVVFSHLVQASIFLYLAYIDFRGYKTQPTIFGKWDKFFVITVQLLLVFDLLGRSLSSTVIAGAYFMMVLSFANLLFAFVSACLAGRAAKLARANQQSATQMAQMPGPPPFPQPFGNGCIDEGQPQDIERDTGASFDRSPSRQRKRRSFDSLSSDDSDTIRSMARHSRPRRRAHTYYQARPAYVSQPASPISLHDPRQVRARQARERSLSVGHLAHTHGQHAYSNFQQRTRADADFFQGDYTASVVPQMSEVAGDGFAQRARQWQQNNRR